METNVYVHGIGGRMGQTITALVEKDSSLSLQNNLETADVAIDFSSHEALADLLKKCVQLKKPVVVGTTGHSPENMLLLQEMSKQIPILFSPNFSLGIAVTLEAAKQIAQQLKGLCQIEIIEAHHQTKKDKPSGTALKLAQEVRGNCKTAAPQKIDDFDTSFQGQQAGPCCADETMPEWAGEEAQRKMAPKGRFYGAHEFCNCLASDKEIPIHSIRSGDIIGDHTVVFMLAGERIELKHQAESREAFARGALLAAKFLKTKPSGLYSVKDLFHETR